MGIHRVHNFTIAVVVCAYESRHQRTNDSDGHRRDVYYRIFILGNDCALCCTDAVSQLVRKASEKQEDGDSSDPTALGRADHRNPRVDASFSRPTHRACSLLEPHRIPAPRYQEDHQSSSSVLMEYTFPYFMIVQFL